MVIALTEVEKAIINKAGLRDFTTSDSSGAVQTITTPKHLNSRSGSSDRTGGDQDMAMENTIP